MRARLAGLAGAAAIVALAACSRQAPDPSQAPAGSSSAASASDRKLAGDPTSAPSALHTPHTTDPGIALGNLNGQIRVREGLAKDHPGDVKVQKTLIDFVLSRGQFVGSIADYEHAAALADDLVKRMPKEGDAHLARAGTLGTFHQFDAELAELDLAQKLGADPSSVATVRATAYLATGRYDEAEATGVWKDEAVLKPAGFVGAAMLAGEMGKAAESDRLFELARAHQRDPSPFALAWMDFQRGYLLERHGDRVRAKLYYEEAHHALPGFPHAAVHLAMMDTAQDAVTLLQPLVGKTDDPEVDAAYGDALRRVGRTAEAKTAIDRARARYEELLVKHPAAFANHAAAFYLGVGADAKRALVLAKQNAKVRHTETALELELSAALAAGDHDEACAAARDGHTLKYATDAFRTELKTTLAGCPDAGT